MWDAPAVNSVIGAVVVAVVTIITLWKKLDAIHAQTNSNLDDVKAKLAAALKEIEKLKRKRGG